MLHSVNEKPRELNVMSTAARCPLGGANHNNTRMQDAQPLPMTMPYPYYPSPHMYYPMPQQQWAPQPVPPGSHPFASQQNLTMPPRSVRGPAISAWLQYCDRHPTHQGENFAFLAAKFDEQGYRTIDQLTGSRMTVENLSGWLSIGKGTADYIIQYADEDMVLVRNGKFTMDLSNVDNSGNNWVS